MKLGTHLISVTLLIQTLCSPALSTQISFTESEPANGRGVLNGRAAIKTIGPLHLSEGTVSMQENRINVLSDSQDAPEEAELVGTIIDAQINVASNTISGTAFFTRGYSISALDSNKTKESIQTLNGVEYSGRIIDVQPNLLRIKTASTSVVIPTRQIKGVKSSRAYQFSLPINSSATSSADSSVNSKGGLSTSSSLSPPTSSPVDKASIQITEANPPLISFRATNNQNMAPPYLLASTKSLTAQLKEKHNGKRAMTIAAASAAAIACLAIPAAIAATAARPGSSHATGASSNGQ